MSLAHGATSSVQVWGEESLEVIFPARLAGGYLFLLTCGDRYLALQDLLPQFAYNSSLLYDSCAGQ